MTMQLPLIANQNCLALADQKISRGMLQDAQALLMNMVSEMPRNWRPARKLADGRVEIAFWNTQEYQHYLPYFYEHGIGQEIIRVSPSYSRAYYMLAFIAVEQKDWSKALIYVNEGLELEPDHPELLCEKALIMKYLGHDKEAYELYVNAVYARAWNSADIQAKAMRGAGIVLEELGNLEAAAIMLKKSLELEPGNQLAMNELSHIYLRRMEMAQHPRAPKKRWWKFW